MDIGGGKKNGGIGIKLTAGIAILAALFYFAGIDRILGALATFDLPLLAPVTVLFILTIFINGINVKILLDAHFRLDLLWFMRNYFTSWAVGSVLPGKVGDFSLAYFLKDNIAPAKTVGIILLDKLITLMILSLAGSASIALFLGAESAVVAVISICALWITGIAFLFTGPAKGLLSKIFPQQLRGHFKDFALVVPQLIANEKSRIALNAALTVARLAAQAGAIAIIYLGVGEHVGFFDIFMISAASTLMSFIPFTMGGLGLREGSFTLLASSAGIPIEKTAVMIFVSIAISYAIVGIILLAFGWGALRFLRNADVPANVPRQLKKWQS